MHDSDGTIGSTEVTSPTLLDHASAISRLGDELTGAHNLAGHVTVTADAYGQTCARVASMLNAVADAAGKAVQAGIDAMEAEESKLRATAATYVDTETKTAGVFTEISGQLA